MMVEDGFRLFVVVLWYCAMVFLYYYYILFHIIIIILLLLLHTITFMCDMSEGRYAKILSGSNPIPSTPRCRQSRSSLSCKHQF